MVAGRIDLLLADSVAMKGGFLDTEQGKDYEFVGPDFSDPKYFGDGAGIALRKDDDDLREKLNAAIDAIRANAVRSEEHTSDIQLLLRISYPVSCLKKKKIVRTHLYTTVLHPPTPLVIPADSTLSLVGILHRTMTHTNI